MEKWYKPKSPLQGPTVPNTTSTTDDMDPFAALFDSQPSVVLQTDTLDDYLAMSIINLRNNTAVKGDPLKWWCLKLKSNIDSVDPNLACMAIDLLLIPAIATDTRNQEPSVGNSDYEPRS
ncbi:hypothetical protein K435DRAFT_834115 [Dendrothele bispora CBS 962.96]|uniref:Uncharacterized protein n=1 Tax=Dendrothele bispora (strain CBS 962.96) TaxID=1314807 RepID=A0A4S8MUC8_DENBC|nr:hypothetical protein K435DRAFT_834115 [Dendrothele bispora CBS 962.96]